MIKSALRNFIINRGFSLKNCSAQGDPSFYEIYPKTSLEEKRFFNIGPGNFKHKYWTNVDKLSDWYSEDNKNCDLEYDMLKKDSLPIEDSSAEIIYSSHVIEHVWDEHAEFFMKESFRALKQGGIFRVTCPDIELAIKAVNNYDIGFFRALGYPHSLKECFAWYYSNILDPEVPEKITSEELNRIFTEKKDLHFVCEYLSKISNLEFQNKRVGLHVNWFNENKVIKMLEEAGFQIIEPSRFLQSQAAVLRDQRYFDNTFPMMSLYVEAVK